MEILKVLGKLDPDPDYDYKEGRYHRKSLLTRQFAYIPHELGIKIQPEVNELTSPLKIKERKLSVRSATKL